MNLAKILKTNADRCKLTLLQRIDLLSKAGLYQLEVDCISDKDFDILKKENIEVLDWEGYGSTYLLRWSRS